MITQAEDFERFLRVLDRQGCLPDVMVVGSWAEFLYREARLLNGFEPNLKTMDIDFLVRNMRKPQPPVNVLVAAREAGYVPDADYLDGTTKIYSDSGLEIEFLIGKKGAGREAALKTQYWCDCAGLMAFGHFVEASCDCAMEGARHHRTHS